MFSSKTYDILKKIVTIVLPALQALWLTLGEIWGFPYVTQIGATVAAITVFLGALIGISNAQYKNTFEIENINSNYDGAEPIEEKESEV